MNNLTGYDDNTTSQNCYVDLTNPYNLWGYGYPWYSWPLTHLTYPLAFYTETTDTTAPTTEPLSITAQPESTEPPSITEPTPDEDLPTDLADMIHAIVRDELSRIQHAEKSTKGIAREVLKLLKDELRVQGVRHNA